jgi:hypothetical protein
MFKKIIAILMLSVSTAVLADFRMIVPQQVGGGTDIWARIVAKELEKKLGERIIIENIPGINDIPGFNRFHNDLRKDPKTIMVAHGGNAESFLLHKVDYNYRDYAPIGLQNLTIVVGHRVDSDPFRQVRFSAGSGMNPDIMAITMLICGPSKSMKEYEKCFNEKVIYVKGMRGNERRLAYMRGELNVTRETTAAYFKHPKQMKENTEWFSHGIIDINTGKIIADPNFPGFHFNEVYKNKWGIEPSGEFYDAYILIKNFRDVLQKSLWVDKNNPNRDRLVRAINAMIQDPDSIEAIEKDTGKYQWIIGDDVNKALSVLDKQLTKKSLENLVWWTSTVIKQDAIYKEELFKMAK